MFTVVLYVPVVCRHMLLSQVLQQVDKCGDSWESC